MQFAIMIRDVSTENSGAVDTIQLVDAKPVTVCGYLCFAHRRGREWTISHASTGGAVGSAPTKREAIANAQRLLQANHRRIAQKTEIRFRQIESAGFAVPLNDECGVTAENRRILEGRECQT